MTSTVGETLGFFGKTNSNALCPGRTINRNPVSRALLAFAAAAILSGAGGVAQSGPCTIQIVQFEHQIAAANSGPTAIQSVRAQLHYQPTPGTIEQAAHAADEDGDVALESAKQADSAGDQAGCIQALIAARRLYTINQ
ncbi:MAG TPA: hypothetical protein VHU22_04765 [Xanthobacteraceae bacterium]|nr:hypothetical protein [Xanthobacteraceae bacterium]